MEKRSLWNWWTDTPNRSLAMASQAIDRMETLRDEYLRARGPLGARSSNTLESAEDYLEVQFRQLTWIARIRMIEFRASRVLPILPWDKLEGRGGADLLIQLQKLDQRVTNLAAWRQQLDIGTPPKERNLNDTQTSAVPSSETRRTLAFEKTGLVPRSITRTLDRFRRELSPSTETLIIQEFRISRYQMLASLRYLASLVIIPWLISFTLKTYLVCPIATYWWNESRADIFLNSYQQERAFREMQAFQETLYFEMLTGDLPPLDAPELSHQLQLKGLELAEVYNEDSIQAITNLVGDFVAVGTLTILLSTGSAQIAVLKSFLDELLYSLSDATKAFLIILSTDVFVGFHSPHGWEVLLEVGLRHIGLPESPNFIFLFVATFPVVLDTVFKYWIFRYLNQISPSAVATYRNMNE